MFIYKKINVSLRQIFSTYFKKIHKHSVAYIVINLCAIVLALGFYYVERQMETIVATLKIGLINGNSIEDPNKILKKITEVKNTKYIGPLDVMTISANSNAENSEISIYIKTGNSKKATEYINQLISELITRHNIQIQEIRDQMNRQLKKSIFIKNLLIKEFKNCIDLKSENYLLKEQCQKNEFEIINGINSYNIVINEMNNTLNSLSNKKLIETIIVEGPHKKIDNIKSLYFYVIKLFIITILCSNSLFIFIVLFFKKNNTINTYFF